MLNETINSTLNSSLNQTIIANSTNPLAQGISTMKGALAGFDGLSFGFLNTLFNSFLGLGLETQAILIIFSCIVVWLVVTKIQFVFGFIARVIEDLGRAGKIILVIIIILILMPAILKKLGV